MLDTCVLFFSYCPKTGHPRFQGYIPLIKSKIDFFCVCVSCSCPWRSLLSPVFLRLFSLSSVLILLEAAAT